jgi:hypothetical protein
VSTPLTACLGVAVDEQLAIARDIGHERMEWPPTFSKMTTGLFPARSSSKTSDVVSKRKSIG